MISKWFELKQEAINLRKQGKSIREIETLLKIPRSTLSGWFRLIKLTKQQSEYLRLRWLKEMKAARKKAVLWHNHQKQLRIEKSKRDALLTLSKIKIDDKYLQELSLAMLYLGEGSKTQYASLGNSNPLIVNYYIRSLKNIYDIDKNDLKFELHLRSDQDIDEKVTYWSKIINAPKENFRAVKDKRLVKSKSYTNYNGVCVVYGGGIEILRRLVFLSEQFCYKIANT